MLRRDFLSKIIEQMVNSIGRLLKIDYEKETEKFIDDFEELLKTYFQINSEELEKLLEEDEERDSFLLDEKLKNSELLLFIHAGLAFAKDLNFEKANRCLAIVQRIQNKHSGIFEFPTQESLQIESKTKELESLIK